MAQTSSCNLSICIATFNRAAYIGATLESILAQLDDRCEIVVSDNASTDNTDTVVSEYARQCKKLRYVRQDTNKGMDCNFDCAVQLAQGEYCWLMGDDDFLKPGAIAAVLKALRDNYSLVLVNGDVRDQNMSKVRVPNFFGIDSDRIYDAGDLDHLFTGIGTCLISIGSIVIKRTIWLARERQRYYGSWFIHVAVILQKPLPGRTLVMAEPFLSFRSDNKKTWASETFQIIIINYPSLVWSMPLSEAAKRTFSSPEPWRRFRYLLALRAIDRYSLVEYRRWIRPRLHSLREAFVAVLVSILPRKLALRIYTFYSRISGAPTSPHDVVATMFPESMKAMREPSPT